VDLSPWGKKHGLCRPYPLAFHLLDTAAVARELWCSFLVPNQRQVVAHGLGLDEPRAKDVVAFWAGLHDIGKLNPTSSNSTPSPTVRFLKR
jgi:CRISPR-associated endonuclease/helicase Cas3